MSAVERREQIIAAAREVFIEQGVTGTRSRQSEIGLGTGREAMSARTRMPGRHANLPPPAGR